MKRLIVSLMTAICCIHAFAAGDSLSFIRPLRSIYLTSGIPVDGTVVDKNTGDVKFQFSFAIPLWSSMGGINGLDLKIGYTQRSVWMLYAKSSPLKDNTYIPGVYLDVPFKTASDKLLCGVEHRSNGRDDNLSRSVNYIFGEYSHRFPFGLTLAANARFGIGWYDDYFTQAIFYNFYGYATVGALYENGRFSALASVTPVFAPFKLSTTAELSFRLARSERCPFHLFVQYHYGYDECMCDCVYGSNPPHYLRAGILISTGATSRLSM